MDVEEIPPQEEEEGVGSSMLNYVPGQCLDYGDRRNNYSSSCLFFSEKKKQKVRHSNGGGSDASSDSKSPSPQRYDFCTQRTTLGIFSITFPREKVRTSALEADNIIRFRNRSNLLFSRQHKLKYVTKRAPHHLPPLFQKMQPRTRYATRPHRKHFHFD